MNKKIKTGIIGLGTMGQGHLKTLVNDVPSCEVTAVCDVNSARFAEADEKGILNENVTRFASYEELLDSKLCDAVIVVTPHPRHPDINIAAFQKDLHVLCDKPIASTIADGDRMIEAWLKTKVVFSTMHSMRTTSVNKIIKQWIDERKLGEIRRVDMVCTQWLRSQKYYDEQAWRGTWAGEGSGLLLNQAPHNLDLLYWWFGQANSVVAKATNRFHEIETDDEVDARIITKSGFPVRFYATTGEAPGVDRVEIVGTTGTLVRHGGKETKLIFKKLKTDLATEIQESAKGMLDIESEGLEIEIPDLERGHKVVFRDFFDAIINDRPNHSLISPGDEGVYSLELANAMLLSSMNEREIELPIDRQLFDDLIMDLKGGKQQI